MADLRDLNMGKAILKTNQKWAKFDEKKLEIVRNFSKYADIGDYLAAIGAHIMV